MSPLPRISNDLLLNTNLNPKKKSALCTISNDLFLDGTRVLIYSFVKHNPWFNGEIVVITCKEKAQLSEASRAAIKRIYPNLFFHEVNFQEYFHVFSRFSKLWINSSQKRFLPSFLTYEAFDLVKKYDHLLYLDSDMLVRSNLAEVFNLETDLPVVTPDAGEFNINRLYQSFNGGFLYLTPKIDKNLKTNLLEYSLHCNDHALAEQSIMNSFFKQKVLSLDSRYNCLKRCFPNSKFKDFEEQIKIIHYVGAKPWHSKKVGREANYSLIEKLWHSDYSEMINMYGK